MKKIIAMLLLFAAPMMGFGQNNGEKKATRQQEKLTKKSEELQKAERKGQGRKSVRKLKKMEKSEDKLNKRAEEMK